MNRELLLKELQFKAVRSSGAGGQNVNKVSSKVVLFWDLVSSSNFSDFHKEKIKFALNQRLTKQGVLVLECDNTPSQIKNKQLVIKRFLLILEDALRPVKPRVATKVSKTKLIKRKEIKKQMSTKKQLRKPPIL